MLGTVRIPLDILDDDGWSSTSIKTQKAVTPLKLYYTPNVPNGSIFLWPIPTTSSQVELEMENLLQQIADLNTQLDLPTGYQAAMTLTLAETLEHSLGFPPTPGVVAGANRARLKIQQRKVESPRSGTREMSGCLAEKLLVGTLEPVLIGEDDGRSIRSCRTNIFISVSSC
jgi:hypothetical protein